MGKEEAKILMLEDNDFDAEIIKDTLINEGFNISWHRVTHKDEYLKALDAEHFEVIISDYTLPEFTDLEALLIKKNKNIDTPFIYLSGTKSDKSGFESLKEGAADFIYKEDMHRLAPSLVKAMEDSRKLKNLREHNKKLNELLHITNDFILTINSQEIIQMANTRASRLFQTNPEDMEGLHLSNFLNKNSYHQFRECLKIVFETRKEHVAGIEAELPYGNRLLQAKFIPELEKSTQKIKSVSIIFIDITEEKSSEASISEETINNVKMLFDNAPDAFYLRDLDGYIIDINRATERITGYSKEEAIGKHFLETGIIPERSKERFKESLQKGNKGENTEPTEFEIINKQGESLIIEKTSYPFFYKGNQLILGIARDITPRKKAEKQLKQSEEKFKALVNSTEDIIFLMDNNYIFRNLFGKGLKKLGFNQEKYVGKKPQEIFEQETARIHTSAIEKAFKGEFRVYNWSFNTPVGERFFQTSLSPIYDEYYNIHQLVGISRDITDIHEMLRKVEEAKEKAEENDRLKSAFLANISHEIRTPMNGIMGFAQLLKGAEHPREKQVEFLDIINSRAQHLLQIINDIIDISKIESNQLSINKIETNINQSLNELLLFYKNEATIRGKQNIQLVFDEGSKDEILYTDKERLEQIVSNLLDNAIKFSSSGTIRFGYHEYPGDKLLFYVKDHGMGIPYDKQNIVFKPFRQVDSRTSRMFEGTGLGLAITKQLTELLGGEIWVESEPGKGSTFYFTLPNEKGINKAKPRTKKNLSLNLQGKTIMIVEDDYRSRQYMEELMRPTHADILVAEDGTSAWETFRKNNAIALILMDIRLPDMSGLELTERIKKVNPQLPVIAQTAYAMTTDKNIAMEKGCDDYLSKPIHKNELYKLIQKHIKENGHN